MSAIQSLIAKGFGRVMTVGAFSTGIVGGGNGTVIDLDQPEFIIGVPGGYAIVPFYVEMVVQGGVSTADGDETEALLAVDSLGLYRGDGTVTRETPSNLRTDFEKGSACNTASACTADLTTSPRGMTETAADPVLDIELAHIVETADQAGTAANASYRIIRVLYEPRHAPILVGPCSLVGYWGGTIATVGGFAVVKWVEGRRDEILAALGA